MSVSGLTSIPVTLERVEFRITSETPQWQRWEYGIPDAFVPGDGTLRVTIYPTIPGFSVYAVRLFAKSAEFDTAESGEVFEQRALFFGSEFYQQQYGLPIHKAGTLCP